MQKNITDDFHSAILRAQNRPEQEYIIWAELPEGAEMPLATAKLPQGSSEDEAVRQITSLASTSLANAGILGNEQKGVRLRLDELITEMEVRALIDPLIEKGEELVLVDLPIWEAVRCRLHIPVFLNKLTDEQELVIEGLHIQRSAVG